MSVATRTVYRGYCRGLKTHQQCLKAFFDGMVSVCHTWGKLACSGFASALLLCVGTTA